MSIKCPSNVRCEPSIETDVNVTVLSDSLQRNPSATVEVEVEEEVEVEVELEVDEVEMVEVLRLSGTSSEWCAVSMLWND